MKVEEPAKWLDVLAPKPESATHAPCCGIEAAGKDRITRVRELPDPDHLPALDPRYAIERPALDLGPLDHPPRILLLYGSLRSVSYSRAVVEEAARLLRFFGAEPRIFDPSDLSRSGERRQAPGRAGTTRTVDLVGGASLVQPGTARPNYRADEGAN
jgi:hypothetical protein